MTKTMLTKTWSRNSTSGSCLLNGQPLPVDEERAFFEDCSLDFEPYVTLSINHEIIIITLSVSDAMQWEKPCRISFTEKKTRIVRLAGCFYSTFCCYWLCDRKDIWPLNAPIPIICFHSHSEKPGIAADSQIHGSGVLILLYTQHCQQGS